MKRKLSSLLARFAAKALKKVLSWEDTSPKNMLKKKIIKKKLKFCELSIKCSIYLLKIDKFSIFIQINFSIKFYLVLKYSFYLKMDQLYSREEYSKDEFWES